MNWQKMTAHGIIVFLPTHGIPLSEREPGSKSPEGTPGSRGQQSLASCSITWQRGAEVIAARRDTDWSMLSNNDGKWTCCLN
jgi:hypothetical protein